MRQREREERDEGEGVSGGGGKWGGEPSSIPSLLISW